MKLPYVTSSSGGHKIYQVSGSSSGNKLDWLKNVSAKSKKRQQLQRGRVEILQDFEFPTFCSKVKQSLDGNYIIATGGYPPQVRVYDVHQVSLKFERHLDYDIIDFQILEEDWKKLVFLCTDRRLEFHSQYGTYYRTRIPKTGRDLMIDRHSADLHIVTSGPEVYRLNLDRGQFMAPWETALTEGINVCGMNPVFSMMAYGGEDGFLEMWDPRYHKKAGFLNVASFIDSSLSAASSEVAITSLRFDEMDGVSLAVGLSTGHCLLFDIRSSSPLVMKDQGYGLPIEGIKFHKASRKVLSNDKKSIKIWQRENGNNFALVEPKYDIHHTCFIGESGLVLAATEDRLIHSYYIPILGNAPKWCSFLDNLTEELEEQKQPMVYENYQFVTQQELESIGLQHLIGSELLRPYMHGFFMDLKLYRKAKDAAQPQAYEEYRKQKIQEKLQAIRSSRIAKQPKYKVNKKLAEKLEQQSKQSILKDSRFQAMFEDPDFEVNPENDRYQRLHSSQVPKGSEDTKKVHVPMYHSSDDITNQSVHSVGDMRKDSKERLPLLARLEKTKY
eukprot:jgi/Galph1/6032/GphlegSOOS_G4659.1